MRFSTASAALTMGFFADLHPTMKAEAQPNMVKMCLFYDDPSGHARSDPIINQGCASDHVHTYVQIEDDVSCKL